MFSLRFRSIRSRGGLPNCYGVRGQQHRGTRQFGKPPTVSDEPRGSPPAETGAAGDQRENAAGGGLSIPRSVGSVKRDASRLLGAAHPAWRDQSVGECQPDERGGNSPQAPVKAGGRSRQKSGGVAPHRSPLPPTAVAGAREARGGGGGGGGPPDDKGAGRGTPRRRRGLRHATVGREPAALRVIKRAEARKDTTPRRLVLSRQRRPDPTEPYRRTRRMPSPRA